MSMEYNRRHLLATAGAAFTAGCAGRSTDGSDSQGDSDSTTDTDGPATYPTSPTVFGADRWVETADGYARYRPRSVTAMATIDTYGIDPPTPDEWSDASVSEVEPSSPLVIAVMEFHNLAEGPDDVPGIDTGTAIVLGDDERTRPPERDVRLTPVDADAESATVDVNQIVSPADYSLHPESGPFANVGSGKVVRGWFATTVPDVFERDDVHPAMGSGGRPLNYPARWDGYNLTAGNTDE